MPAIAWPDRKKQTPWHEDGRKTHTFATECLRECPGHVLCSQRNATHRGARHSRQQHILINQQQHYTMSEKELKKLNEEEMEQVAGGNKGIYGLSKYGRDIEEI